MAVRLGRGAARAALALGGLLLAAAVWYSLPRNAVSLLFDSWVIPAVALLQLLQQVMCGLAWHRVAAPPAPSRWSFVRARWVRAAFAALLPLSGVGAALVAVRLIAKAGLSLEIAAATLVFDATLETLTQVVFTVLGVGLFVARAPDTGLLFEAVSALAVVILLAAGLIAVQRIGGFKLVEAGLAWVAGRWPGLAATFKLKIHDALMALYRQRRASLCAGAMHLSAWGLGAVEVWLVLYAYGHGQSLSTCLIIESLSMIGRSAGFFIPGALGAQELALLVSGEMVGLTPEAAIVLAVAKRLRDLAMGAPALLLWAGLEGRWALRRSPPKAAGIEPVTGPAMPK